MKFLDISKNARSFRTSYFKTKFQVLNLFFFLLSYSISFAQITHINYPNIPNGQTDVFKVDMGDTESGSHINGIRVESVPLNIGQTGIRTAIRVSSSSLNSTQAGTTVAIIGSAKSFGGDGAFTGVLVIASATALSNSNNLYSRAVGGYFRADKATNLTLDSGKYYVGGVLAELEGEINGNPTDGAIAAVIGRNTSTGTAQSWAAYLDGRNYLSDKTIIGRKDIPTTANNMDVSAFNLFVKGGILTEECIVALENLWADYVFEEDYDLKSLEEVEQYIEKNGYLPAFPSALEIDKTGLALGQITVLQQEKIEELFLHSIEINKQNKALTEENERLKAQMAAFEERLTALENK